MDEFLLFESGTREKETKKILKESLEECGYNVEGNLIYRNEEKLGELSYGKALYDNIIDDKFTKNISKEFFPLSYIYLYKKKELFIFDRKFQSGSGSTDMKIPSAIFKKEEYQKMCTPMNIKVKYVLIVNSDQFENETYDNLFEYIKSNGCYYFYDKVPIDFVFNSKNRKTDNSLFDKEICSNKITKIKNYISTQNFNYEDGMIENFYLSLKTKPFVMLAGISGTGKTKLVELFAKAIGCENNFEIIPVKPDWSDTSDLLGYKNLKGEFNPGPLMDIIVKANADEEDRIHFVCLDEMNLARVEYYFSDFLSIMETRHFDGHKIVSKPLFKEDYFEDDNDDDNSDRKKYAGVYFPQNLYFIGTVNMDETTYPFSKKVLDRGNTIEFSNVDLTDYTLSNNDFSYEPIEVENSFLVSEKLTINDCNLNEKELIDKVVKLLAKVNEILKSESIHFGYRIRDEVVFYMLYNSKYNLLDFDEALDFQLMQKILPRIQGSTNSIKNILLSLLEFCGFENLGTEKSNINDLLTEEKLEACTYKRTATKLAYMIKKLEVDGFTSYWL